MSSPRADDPQPPRPPMWTCGDCGTSNEQFRDRCRNCGARQTSICRTPEEAFQRGWEDGAEDPPLTERQILRLAVLLAPHVRADCDAAA